MQFLIEFFPLILFLVAYVQKDIYFALIVLMVAMPVGLLLKYWRTKTWDKMYLWSTVFLLVMGAATLYFRNPAFLYWKPTVFYWVVGAAFLISGFVGGKPLARRFFELTGELPTEQISVRQWTALNLTWVAFFAGAGLLNIWVAYSFEEPTWVRFKVFGLLAITFVFMLAQGVWLMSRLKGTELEATDEDAS